MTGQRQLEGGSFGSRGFAKEFRLAKRNYGFEKRQKEIARKQKQEDKRLRNLERGQAKPDEALPDADGPVVSDPSE